MPPGSGGRLVCGFYLGICTSLVLCEVRAEKKSVTGSAFVHKNTLLPDFSLKWFHFFLFIYFFLPQPRCPEGVCNQARGTGN